MAKVLIGCETSGIVREAFIRAGHDAWSCDVLPSDIPTNKHFVADVRDVMVDHDWVLFVAPTMHKVMQLWCSMAFKTPPGKTLDEMWQELDEGADLFSDIWNRYSACSC